MCFVYQFLIISFYQLYDHVLFLLQMSYPNPTPRRAIRSTGQIAKNNRRMTRYNERKAAAALQNLTLDTTEDVPHDESNDIVPTAATGGLSDTHEVTGVGTSVLDTAEVDERAGTGGQSDTPEVGTVVLDTAEGLSHDERAAATGNLGDNQDFIGVRTYELDSPEGAAALTATVTRDQKEEDIRSRSQKLLDNLRRWREECFICTEGIHDKSGVTAKSIDCSHDAKAHFECMKMWFEVYMFSFHFGNILMLYYYRTK